MTQLHMARDIRNGWQPTPPGVMFCPAVGGSDWPDRPDDLWANGRLSLIPTDWKGLVMLDNEGWQYNALWKPMNEAMDVVKRDQAIYSMVQQVDRCNRQRPGAKFGFYGVPTGGWAYDPMPDSTREYGYALDAIYRHQDVVMPSLYVPSILATSGSLKYGEYILQMASTVARVYKRPLAVVVGTRCYANGDLQAQLLTEAVLRKWMQMVMKYRPNHLIYWHNEPWFVRNRNEAPDESLIDELAASNVATALNLFSEFCR